MPAVHIATTLLLAERLCSAVDGTEYDDLDGSASQTGPIEDGDLDGPSATDAVGVHRLTLTRERAIRDDNAQPKEIKLVI